VGRLHSPSHGNLRRGLASPPHGRLTTTLATVPDVIELPRIQEHLAQRARLPAQHLVDAGYTRASNLVSSRERHQIELVGPVDTDHRWQSRVEDGFTTERFIIGWEQKQAICPAGRASIRWCETHTARQRTMIHIDFAADDCLTCLMRSRCTRATARTAARSLTLQPYAEYVALLAGRTRQQTPEFATLYAQRAGIEGTISQGVRALGLRRARYRGRAKTQLQDVATATAINLVRLDDWLHGVPLAATRRSRLTRLAIA
jgi:transposase